MYARFLKVLRTYTLLTALLCTLADDTVSCAKGEGEEDCQDVDTSTFSAGKDDVQSYASPPTFSLQEIPEQEKNASASKDVSTNPQKEGIDERVEHEKSGDYQHKLENFIKWCNESLGIKTNLTVQFFDYSSNYLSSIEGTEQPTHIHSERGLAASHHIISGVSQHEPLC